MLRLFGGPGCRGVDEESIPVFTDYLREHGHEELADLVDAGSFRSEVVDSSIPHIDSFCEEIFPHRKQLGLNRFAYVMPLLFGAGRLCVGPMNCTGGFDDWYDYQSHDLAVDALEQWNGLGSPPDEGMTRRSGVGGKIVRVAQ